MGCDGTTLLREVHSTVQGGETVQYRGFKYIYVNSTVLGVNITSQYSPVQYTIHWGKSTLQHSTDGKQYSTVYYTGYKKDKTQCSTADNY